VPVSPVNFVSGKYRAGNVHQTIVGDCATTAVYHAVAAVGRRVFIKA
jgi:hypothetical protein